MQIVRFIKQTKNSYEILDNVFEMCDASKSGSKITFFKHPQNIQYGKQ